MNLLAIRIARPFVIYILLFSSLITILLTALQLYQDYQKDLQRIDQRFQMIEETNLPLITDAVWTLNRRTLQINLDGLLRYSDIVHVRVVQDDGTVLATAGAIDYSEWLVRTFSLTQSHRGESVSIGILQVIASLNEVYQRLWDTFLMILITHAVKTFLVSGFIIWLVYYLIVRHLASLVQHTRNFTADKSFVPFKLQRHVGWLYDNDELSQLSDAFNQSQENLQISYQQSKERVNAEEVLGNLLQASLNSREYNDYLRLFMQQLLKGLSWDEGDHHAALFIRNREEYDGWVLQVRVGLSQEDFSLYTSMMSEHSPTGRGLDGLSDEVNNSSDLRICEMMECHNRYVVPVIAEQKLAGIMIIRLPDGAEKSEHNLLFLKRVAVVLGMGIERFNNERKLAYRSMHDSLTSLPNRRLLLEHLQYELGIAKREERTGVLIVIDLDAFKHLNDAKGHPVGDQLIKLVGSQLESVLRQGDMAARMGGDEFALLLSQSTEFNSDAMSMTLPVLSRLRSLLSTGFDIDGYQYHPGFSSGVVFFPEGGNSAHELLRNADVALYEAKSAGGGRDHFFHQGLQELAENRLQIEVDMRLALDESRFFLNFQPQVNSRAEIVGAEVLVRWQNTVGKQISPLVFIPVAEESGQIHRLGVWIFTEACRHFKKWLDQGMIDTFDSLSINISPRQFYADSFVDWVISETENQGIDPKYLILEITEGILLEDIEKALARMQTLREHGFSFSIDDFGTGYSSLRYLQQLPIDELKIDKSFIDDIGPDSEHAVITESIIAMANNFGLNLVAEGVEKMYQHNFLKRFGEIYIQGYLYHRPLSADELEKLILKS